MVRFIGKNKVTTDFFKPGFCGTGMADAVTTAAWTDDEAEALAIQPAKALALAVAVAGRKGYMKQINKILINQHDKLDL